MINPILGLDVPDPDVIRVGDTWYMASSTMHFMPGGQILRSFDLVHWEHLTYVYNELEDLPAHHLQDGKNIYGKGMWAPCLRYHQDCFYLCFSANDTGKTYLFTSGNIEGPWEKKCIKGFYHDCSLLFDQDRVFIASGNTTIRITELESDLSGPKTGGLDRIALSEQGNTILGYEGSHFYRIHDKYVLCLVHSRPDRWRRVQACFVADSLEGEFRGKDILDDDRGYCNQGVAQGGMVDTPDGDWYTLLFQDHGAAGRIPVLVPLVWKDGFPVPGNNGKICDPFPVPDTRPGHHYAPLTGSDNFRTTAGHQGSPALKAFWQWNHLPNQKFWYLDHYSGKLTITTGSTCKTITQTPNVLTQRMSFPRCSASVTVDASNLAPGDFAGIAAFQSLWGLVAVTRNTNGWQVCMINREARDNSLASLAADTNFGTIRELVEIPGPQISLRVDADFEDMKDTACFYYHSGLSWHRIGPVHKLFFTLDHFCGCRCGLFVFSTLTSGGSATFSDFTQNLT